MARFPATSGVLLPRVYDKFRGYNIVDDPSSLSPGSLVLGSRDIDLTRQLGALPKRLGLEAQIEALGSTLDQSQTTTTSNLNLTPESYAGQTFTTGASSNYLDKIEIYGKSGWAEGENVTLTLYDAVAKTSNLGSVTVNGAQGDGTWVEFVFEAPIAVTPSTSYYLELTLNTGTVTFGRVAADAYAGGALYVDGILVPNSDLAFKTYSVTGGVKGIHTFKHSSGERILFGHDEDCYKLSGVAGTLTKTSQADWDAGTRTDVETVTSPGDVKLDADGATFTVDQSQEAQTNDIGLGVGATLGQTITTSASANHIGRIALYARVWANAGEEVTLNLYLWDTDYATTVAGAVLGTVVVDGPQAIGWVNFTFSSPVACSPSTKYLLVLTTSAGVVRFDYSNVNPYAGGALYLNGAEFAGDDMRFRLYRCPYEESGTWESPTYDLGNVLVTSSLAWTATTPDDTSIAMYAKGSEDGQNWGDWQVVVTSGDGIPITRYVKIRAVLSTTDGSVTPTLSDFTITYETAFTQATSIVGSLSGNRIRFVDYEDECYFTEGGRPKRYDNSAVRNVGVDPPGSAPTIAQGGGTGLTGVYKGKFTFVNDHGAESNASDASGEINIANKDINWSGIIEGPAGTVSRKLYRTKAGGSIYYYVTTLEDNTTTVYSGDDTADGDLLTELETDNDIPPDSIIVHEHKDYMLYVSVTNPERLYFSKRGLPDSVPPLAYKSLPGPIKAVKTYQDACIVGGDYFTAAIIGSIWDADPTVNNTVTRVLSNDHGPVSHEAVAECFSNDGDILVFPTRKGLYYLTPGLQEDSLRSVPLSWAVQPIFDGAVNRGNMAAIYAKNRYLLALNYFGNDTPVYTNNIIMVLDLRTRNWSPPWYVRASGFADINGRLFIGSSVVGQILELEKGVSDAGVNIHPIAKLAIDYTPMGVNVKKRFAELQVALATGSDTTSLELKPAVDGVSATLSPGATSGWSGKLLSPRQRIHLGRGYAYQLTVEDDSQLDWIITRVITGYERGE